MGDVSQRTNIHTDIVHLYNQVNQKLKKFDYKYKISTSCGGLFFLNLILLGQLVFLVTMKEPGEMSLTKVVQRLQYCGNYNLFHNLKDLKCYENASLLQFAYALWKCEMQFC